MKAARKLLRIEEDGTHVYFKNNKIFRVTKSTEPTGYYAPFRSRREMYKGMKDPRETREFAEAVRDRRQRTGRMFRAVSPGRQHL